MSQCFYEVRELTINQQRELINRSLKVCFKQWVDVRYPGKMARERSELTVSEVLTKFDESCHVVFIDRGEDSISQNSLL